jgi:perosamine synthetase
MTKPKTIPVTRPLVGVAESEAAARVIASGWLTQGPRVAEFEAAVAQYVGADHAVACSSCTTALHMALLACGVQCGDEVIVPSLSFIATANAVRYCGARPVFVDVDRDTMNLDPAAVARAITARTRVLMPVHQVGLPADLDRFRAIAARHRLRLVEDAACALGSEYKGRRIGAAAEFCCFSFHPRKVITTGEGGMIVTQSAEIAERLRLMRQHGMSVSDLARHRADRPILEDYVQLGFNYRMSDVQAAIGIEQMKRLDGILARRRELATRYTQAIADLPGVWPPLEPPWARSNYQSYVVRLDDDFAASRDEVLAALAGRGVAARPGIMTAHRTQTCRDQYGEIRLPVTEAVSDHTLILPLYPELTDQEQDVVIGVLHEMGGRAHAHAA